MRHKLITIMALALVAMACSQPVVNTSKKLGDWAEYVNPMAGTLSTFNLSTGNTYPAIAVPWGAHFWTPQTGKNGDGWTYRYDATHIRGFKQTHQPSPWINDYGAFSLMPVTTGPYYDEEKRASWFSHKTEVAKPYYYSVYLADHDVTVELVPASHAAWLRFTYPECEKSYLVLDAYEGGKVEVVDEYTIHAWAVNNHGGVAPNFCNYVIVKSDTPFEVEKTPANVAMVSFPTTKGQVVSLKVASSFISLEQARLNLGEVNDPFEEVMMYSQTAWNQALGKIEVEDDNIDHLRTFYTCLYRSLLFPRDLAEIGMFGVLQHYSPHTGEVEKGHFYTDTGFWDTFRSLFPLMNLLYPQVSSQVQEGLVNDYLESGFLPEWASPGHRNCMVGNNSASVVADAYLSGVRDYDIGKLWEAVTHDAHAVHPTVGSSGRTGWEYYDELGYVPCDVGIKENAARTLEYAYDDWCIYQLGKALNIDDEQLAPYKKAALNYRNVFDPEYKLMNGRQADGTFRRPFSPLKWGGDFTEGNSLHYTWSVFHDIEGLIGLMGGEDAFNAQMDTVFVMPPKYDDSYYGFPIHEIIEMTVMGMGNYAHGNQPIQHMLYLYDWSRQPWKTQARVREVMEKFYTPWADAYCGDEDNGQTSAWYVFSALGFYPVCPGSGQYALGTPLFKKATLHLDGGDVVIEAPDNSAENFYVKDLQVNGQEWTRNYLLQSDLQKGAKLHFKMAAEPNLSRGVADEDKPYSFSNEKDAD